MTNREKGVASAACPSCNSELALSDQPDGSVAAQTCASCYPADMPAKKAEKAAEKASVSSAPRERGTTMTDEKE